MVPEAEAERAILQTPHSAPTPVAYEPGTGGGLTHSWLRSHVTACSPQAPRGLRGPPGSSHVGPAPQWLSQEPPGCHHSPPIPQQALGGIVALPTATEGLRAALMPSASGAAPSECLLCTRAVLKSRGLAVPQCIPTGLPQDHPRPPGSPSAKSEESQS